MMDSFYRIDSKTKVGAEYVFIFNGIGGLRKCLKRREIQGLFLLFLLKVTAEKVGHYEGDVRTHLLKINLDPLAEMFYKENAKEYAKGYLTVEYACLDCHKDRNKEWAIKSAKGVHTMGK